MKQLVTNKAGDLKVIEVPAPRVRPGFVLVDTRFSVISAGTEGAQVREGKAGLLSKVKDHPQQVRQILDKAKKEGIQTTVSQVKDKLQEWRTLGYSLSGVVLAVGDGVENLAPGDRVACAGAGYAVHADLVLVPRNLVARVPKDADLRHAAFATLGAIALHGVRRAHPELGETALVLGLGLVGQLAVQFLSLAGVRVAAVDLDPARVGQAVDLGAELGVDPAKDLHRELSAWTRSMGVDMAVVCAGTPSSEPVRTCAEGLRDKGRLVVIGDVGLELEREPFFRKELDFSVSRSYGPGRYDPVYEEGGVDYPAGYVRWTEGRNLTAVLDLLGQKRLQVEPLIDQEVSLENTPEAFQKILDRTAGLGTLIAYGSEKQTARTIQLHPAPATRGDTVGLLLIGAGWFARTHRIPHLARQSGIRLQGVVTGGGANATRIAEKAGASFSGTDMDEGLSQPGVDAVLIATRHHLHVEQAVAAIKAGKHVLMEKPLALDREGLLAVSRALQENPVRFAVGFNRRHAPLAGRLKDLLSGRHGPLHGTYRMNAGRLPRDHWINDPEQGGGRILGEACHAFDFFNFLVGSEPVLVQAMQVRSPDPEVKDDDNLSATVSYGDGSLLTLVYTTAGPGNYPKEQVEVFGSGIAARLVDFRELTWSGRESGKKTLRNEDKGQKTEMGAWVDYLRGGSVSVVEFPEAAMSTWLTIQALRAARTGQVREVASTLAEALGA